MFVALLLPFTAARNSRILRGCHSAPDRAECERCATLDGGEPPPFKTCANEILNGSISVHYGVPDRARGAPPRPRPRPRHHLAAGGGATRRACDAPAARSSARAAEEMDCQTVAAGRLLTPNGLSGLPIPGRRLARLRPFTSWSHDRAKMSMDSTTRKSTCPGPAGGRRSVVVFLYFDRGLTN